MVYLHEIADPRYQPLTGSLGYVSLGVGVVIGILVVICVTNIVPAGMYQAGTVATGAQHKRDHFLYCRPIESCVCT